MFAAAAEIGQFWNRGLASVHPNHTAHEFQFVIEGSKYTHQDLNPGNMTGGSPRAGEGDIEGDIAIDDLSFTVGCKEAHVTVTTQQPTTTKRECQDGEFDCGQNNCISSSKQCDFVVDCPNGLDEVCQIIQILTLLCYPPPLGSKLTLFSPISAH